MHTPPYFKESTNSEHEKHGTENTSHNRRQGEKTTKFQALQEKNQHLQSLFAIESTLTSLTSDKALTYLPPNKFIVVTWLQESFNGQFSLLVFS